MPGGLPGVGGWKKDVLEFCVDVWGRRQRVGTGILIKYGVLVSCLRASRFHSDGTSGVYEGGWDGERLVLRIHMNNVGQHAKKKPLSVPLEQRVSSSLFRGTVIT